MKSRTFLCSPQISNFSFLGNKTFNWLFFAGIPLIHQNFHFSWISNFVLRPSRIRCNCAHATHRHNLLQKLVSLWITISSNEHFCIQFPIRILQWHRQLSQQPLCCKLHPTEETKNCVAALRQTTLPKTKLYQFVFSLHKIPKPTYDVMRIHCSRCMAANSPLWTQAVAFGTLVVSCRCWEWRQCTELACWLWNLSESNRAWTT